MAAGNNQGGALRLRLFYLFCVATAVGAGLATRAFGSLLPSFFALYGGDTLWATMVYFGAAMLLPAFRPWRLFFLSVIFSFSIEVSQLYHAPWIDVLRATRIGGLVLGFGFLYSDLFCYLVGASAAASIDFIFIRRRGNEAPAGI